MRRVKFLAAFIVVAVTLIAVGFLIFTIEKIEDESVSKLSSSGIVMFTTSKDESREVEGILNDIQRELSANVIIKSYGVVNSTKDVEKLVTRDLTDSTNYDFVEFNRSSLILDKGVVTLRIPEANAVNYKDSLDRAKRIKGNAGNLEVNIIPSRNTPNILNTYIGIEISSKESVEDSKRILDSLVMIR
ncbi:MAG: hypothetical protein RR645_03470 [Clostridium sp.]